MDRSTLQPGALRQPDVRAPQPHGRPPQPATKLLRACVVLGGKVIEEQRLRRHESLTIGQGPKNTFVVAEPALPRSHELFVVKSGRYELVLTEGMRGRISVDERPVDFASLKAQGLLEKKGDYYRLPLSERHRGKVMIGDVTIVFQFVVPPPAPAKLQLPAAARGSILKSIDWPYAAVLMTVLFIETPIVTYFHYAPQPAALTLDSIGDRWAKLIVPERKKEEIKRPEKMKGEGPEDRNKHPAKKAPSEDAGPKDEAAKARAAAARKTKAREAVAGKGILAILGTTGNRAASGAVADVFSEGGGIGGDLDAAFDGISGVGIATGSERTTRGGGSGAAASIGNLATKGGGNVTRAGKKERRVGSVATQGPEVDGRLNTEDVARTVRMRLRMVQDCYEKELKRDPSLSGKIEIEFTIGEDGRVSDARVASNRMGSDAVGECIVSRIRRWRFPKPDGGSVTVNYPFIFTPSS